MGISRFDGDGENVLCISGVFDAESVARLQGLIARKLAEGPAPTAVDASRLRLVDAVGVRALVALARQLALKIRGLCGQPLVLFRLLRVEVAPTAGARLSLGRP